MGRRSERKKNWGKKKSGGTGGIFWGGNTIQPYKKKKIGVYGGVTKERGSRRLSLLRNKLQEDAEEKKKMSNIGWQFF